MKNRNILLLLIPFILIGCGQEPQIEFKEPALQVPKEQPVVKRKKGSLYTLKGPSLFADKKDLQIGDIIKVSISESMSSNTNNKREVSGDRKNTLGAGVAAANEGGIAAGVASVINPLTNVGFTQTSNTANDGEVKTSLNESFSSTVSAIIEKTYQNGNYYIRGFKEILVDGQKQTLTLTGVIRPYDITSDNTVTSSQIANLKILYEKDGEEQNVMHLPWGLKIIQMFWPF